MATILPRQESLGEALGTGLGSGLNILLQQQLQNMAARRQAPGLQALLGLNPEQAQAIAQINPAILAPYLKQYGAAQQMARAQGLQQDLANEIAQAELGSVEPERFAQKTEAEQQSLASEPPLESTGEIIRNAKSTAPALQLSSEARLVEGIENLRKKLEDPATRQVLKPGLQKRIDEQEKRLEKISSGREKESLALRSSVTGNYRNAKDLLDILKRQDELNEGGNFQSSGDLAFLEGLGIGDIDSLKSADLQEFIKNNGAFYKNLKGLFGGRITDNEINLFRKTIANEYQSPEGRRRVIASLRKAAEGDVLRFKKMNEIIDQNKGVIPSRLEEKIEEASKKDLKKIRQQWKESLKKAPLAEAESSYTTAAKALGGKALGKAANVGIPAGIGALLGGVAGSAFPGIGTTAGALGGARLGAGLGGLNLLKDFFTR